MTIALAHDPGHHEACGMPRVPSEAATFVGRRIGDRRRMLAVTQDELAARSGIDSSNIRAYENGRTLPSVHSLVRIAIALHVEPGTFIDGLSMDLFVAPEGDRRRRTAQ
ncbi:helix-turn-helix transcriptional regulator [Glaciihabitans sp. UYNi722]|uniref:helix-turn-helix domain-containing protein n=1 Tax=Glaciihabitans sp. UYNi722 TaxID=3156344 RepID=UPI0033937C90